VQTWVLVAAPKQLRAALPPAWQRLRPRSLLAGALSAVLHLAFLIFVVQMQVRSGDPAALPVLFVEDYAPRAPLHELQRRLPEALPLASDIEIEPPQSVEPELAVAPSIDAATLAESPSESESTTTLAPESTAITAPDLPVDAPTLRVVAIPSVQQVPLLERVTQAAQALSNTERAEIAWQEEGREYRAVVERHPASHSMDLERIAARVTTTDQGMSLQTELLFSRLAFSQFTQVIDRWDPNVQLHDDEIVGRFHSNSTFFVGASAAATPAFKGKVTTAARGFRFVSGSRRRQNEIFQGGVETSVDKIDFPTHASVFALDVSPDGQVHRFADDAHITFASDGRYTWQDRRADVAQQRTYSATEPLYLLADRDATLYVRGVVSGQVVVHSPKRIVIEGSVVYAADPREHADSGDYVGLICDGTVEIARPYVTGRGDLRVDAAIFARRHFSVSSIDYARSAKLWIYGSLTAGTVSASEPRYAMKIEFDPRFDRVRPPGFPATNRLELTNWDATWRQIATR
jgi:hypothetical protein